MDLLAGDVLQRFVRTVIIGDDLRDERDSLFIRNAKRAGRESPPERDEYTDVTGGIAVRRDILWQ